MAERRSSDLVGVEAVTKWFGDGPARVTPLDGVDVQVRAGEMVVLTGPSGSGKTTLLQVLAGFLRPDRGVVRWAGVGAGPPGWRAVAVVPQSLGLLAELTVAENVALPLVCAGPTHLRRARRDEARAQVDTWLARLDLVELADRMVGEASLGQQQRVAVARALVAGPSLVVADEPTSHQDGEHADAVLAVLAEVAARGAACVLAGHDPRLGAVATRAVHLEHGRLVPVA